MVFDENRIKKIAELASRSNEEDKKDWTTTAIFEKLDSIIIGNDRYKKTLASTLASYMSSSKTRNHLLVFGPSGSGKTHLLEQALPVFKLPYVVIDASSLVPAGYEGNTLTKSLTDFFSTNAAATERSIIVLDEFDKICEKANGGDAHKSQSIQGELLTNVQGKKEGVIDTRNSLWILLGAFAYADEMKQMPPRMVKNDLIKYGFKNELLGRITRDTITDIPTVEDVIKRLIYHPGLKAFLEELKAEGFREVDFEDEALLIMAQAAQDPRYGMRIIPSLLNILKDELIFSNDLSRERYVVPKELVLKIKKDNF